MQTLTVPPAAQRDEYAIQMLSAWIAENGLHCSMKLDIFQSNGKAEDRSWGILLADVIRHLGNAIGEKYGVAPEQTIDNVVASLLAELDNPTSTARGSFHHGHS
ncbi:MAG: DUF5076 domain-containing protein [Burkholderiales bacterium]